MTDICNKADIQLFVDAFYERVRKDDLLGPVFATKIEADGWGPHLERMYSFWNTVLFAQQDYRGNPFSKHRSLPIDASHFERWIKLLRMTIDENFKGEKAEEVKWRGLKMGKVFQAKLQHLRSDNQYTNLM